MSFYRPVIDRLTATLVLGCWFALAQPAHADVIIIVDTAADVIANDGACSLREAITAANNNANYFGCIGTGGGYDLIEFSLGGGTPVINITSSLPLITGGGLEINGGSNRVELRGNGLVSVGLSISGPSTAGSVIRNLVINGFFTGISVGSTTNIALRGNYLGTSANGNATAGGGNGIDVSGSSVQIGGLSGLTAGGPCTGDCNLISGYTSGGTPSGVLVRDGSTAMILGNFIGINAGGTGALGNGNGIRIEGSSSATVGGIAAGAGNLISGNGNGIIVRITADSLLGSVIQGNRIGTNAGGSGAVPNGNAVDVNFSSNRKYPLTIGGSAAGAGNLISGNSGVGILLASADDVIIYGNRIGTLANGTGPLPNGVAGIQLSSSTHKNVIGGIGAGQGNVIAHNGIGVRIGLNDYHNPVRGNSIHGNAGKGIQLDDQQQNTAFLPYINSVSPVTGTACPGCTVDVYSDSADEGRSYHGSVVANGGGDWSYNGAVTGPYVTATATSLVGSTSEFGAPFPYAAPDSDGDGVVDPNDNCTLVANASQCDSDGDGYGNHCDGDLNNNGFTNAQDYIVFRAQLGKPSVAPTYNQADMNCNGFVNAQDYILFRGRLGVPSGPSGMHP